MKIKLKQLELECITWHDNLSEMKHFCGDDCTITYESCHIDDYYNLSLYDALKRKNVNVALHDYVIKLPDDIGFTVCGRELFDSFFTKEEENVDNSNI